jgi:diaminohydroxyphosphoribosylaminopyrimidine deaminase/5-amino-6-(5-phosphoribosylamino)uracil reductase
MTHPTPLDTKLMQRALDLAHLGRFSTSPNTRVGCVIANNNQIVGEGFHLQAGTPHAEIHALNQAGELAHGATVYVSLEPCAHFGRTPPCANALIQAGVKRVVAAMRDPNPLVAGKGLAMLKAAGIETEYGLLEKQARELNRGFLSRIERKRPFIRAKVAASLDNKTALSDGKSKWITGKAARLDTQYLRAESCAILTGINTILSDNPQLNVRELPTLRQPIRIILDSTFRLPENAQVVQDGAETWVLTCVKNDGHLDSFTNVRVFRLPQNAQSQLDLSAVLTFLAKEEIGELLLEAGEKLTSAFLAEHYIDELVLYQAPKFLGHTAQSAFRLPENPWALRADNLWQTQSVSILDNDIKWFMRYGKQPE